ncbi:MAG: hypothetical protein J1F40_08780 [Prevotellaceae bacterium]|nr:hypothetical protein [Prevotellaceae bacterium]
MKKIVFIVGLLAILASCSSNKAVVIPRAISSIGTATLEDLNLQRSDYEVINTITAEATVSYETNKSGTVVTIAGEDFRLTYTKDKKKGWTCKYSGILKAGYMKNEYSGTRVEMEDPAEIVHRLAIYRLVSQVKAIGGDGVIAPSILTNVEQSNDIIYFRTTASAKAIKLKSN